MIENETKFIGDDAMKTLVWNVNFKGGTEKYGASTELMKFRNVISEENVDAVILDEFYKTDDYPMFKQTLESEGFFVVEDGREAKVGVNQVLIALKKNRFNSINFESVCYPTITENGLNYLAVEVELDGIPTVIIGIRIFDHNITVKGNTVDSYKVCRKNFDELIKMINTYQNKSFTVICGGDFNHARILGLTTKFYSDDELKKSYTRNDGDLAIQYEGGYSYHHIKNISKDNELILGTPEQGNSYRRNKLDHFLVSENVQLSDLRYEWKKDSSERYLSDHAVLLAVISVQKKKG